MLRGLGALGRALGLAWRRSLQLRVVTLTLGLSLAVILVLGFVLTSQITDRILEAKVRAATEEIERARTTVSGIVGGEETRSLDSSLQLARNTLIDRKADPGAGPGGRVRRGAGGARRRAARGDGGGAGAAGARTPCATSSRPARSATSTRPCTPTASPVRR